MPSAGLCPPPLPRPRPARARSLAIGTRSSHSLASRRSVSWSSAGPQARWRYPAAAVVAAGYAASAPARARPSSASLGAGSITTTWRKPWQRLGALRDHGPVDQHQAGAVRGLESRVEGVGATAAAGDPRERSAEAPRVRRGGGEPRAPGRRPRRSPAPTRRWRSAPRGTPPPPRHGGRSAHASRRRGHGRRAARRVGPRPPSRARAPGAPTTRASGTWAALATRAAPGIAPGSVERIELAHHHSRLLRAVPAVDLKFD